MFQPGQVIAFNYEQGSDEGESRRIIEISGVRDTRNDPVSSKTKQRKIRRSRFLVTGANVLTGKYGSFYTDEMANVNVLSGEAVKTLIGEIRQCVTK